MHDLVIRGGTVVDGLGHNPIRADVAVKGGRIAAIGEVGNDASEIVDAGGLTLMPGIIDLHTHYDAQVTWDPTLSPSPSLGVTTAVMGNCGFGIVPAPRHLRDLIMRNLAVVEGMDLDALRTGIDWRFQSFAEYMTMLHGRGAYMNLGVLVGHSAVRTAVMGDDASVRKQATATEMAEMKRLVAEAMDQGAIGLGASYSLNHSGWGGVPMPSTISDISEFDALVGAMGGPGRGVVEISSGPIMPDRMEKIAARHGRRIFMSTAVALYNEQYPERALGVFDACAAAQARGNELYIQITCQPLSFDFTLASAYPFYSHPAFDPIKACDRKQLKAVFRDPSFRERFRADLRNPKPGTVFQGNWERVIVAAPIKPENAGLADRTIADIARETGHDPLDVLLDLGLEENLDTGLIGRFFNAVDDGVEPLVKHKAGVIALSDAGAHLVYLCDAGFGLYFLGHWVRERGAFDLPQGVRRLTSHQAGLYGIPDRGHISVGACADLLLFDPATVGISAPRRVDDLPGGGPRTLRDPIGVHGVFVNGARVFDGKDYVRLGKGPGHVLDRFLPAREPAGARGAINSAATGEAMPVDPQIEALLDKGTGVPATHTLPVDVARAQYEARIALMAPPAVIASVREQTIDGPGGPLRIRIYTPHGTAPFPLLVFFHGSGFVLCSLDTHDGMCRNLCAGAGCVVASVDYRLAPEHKFPAGIEDCLHATRWAAVHATELGATSMCIAVAGDSAGANMSAVTALRVRDEGGPALCGQLLLYPVTAYHTPGTPSYEENAEGYGLTRDTMKWFWAHYLTDASEGGHPYASPLRAADLSGLPPALVITAEYDPLRDEGEFYAEKLRAAGVPTAWTRYRGVNHGFMFWVGVVDKAGAAMTEACEWLRGIFAGPR